MNAMDEKTLLAFARAYDREDAAQMGEPDPWIDGKNDPEWVSERLACASAALSAAAQPAPSCRHTDEWLETFSTVVEGRLTDELAAALGIKQYPEFASLSFDELLDIVRQRLPTPAGESEREPADEFCHHGALRAACPHCRWTGGRAALDGMHFFVREGVRAYLAAIASPPSSPPIDSDALKALREFAESFHFTVTDSFYKDAYLGIHEPDSVTIRLVNNSVESGHIAKLEQRRRAALSSQGRGDD